MTISKSDSSAMRHEADEFLHGMPHGLQATQTHAVNEAINGNCELLNDVRESRNVAPEISGNVIVRDFSIDNSDGNRLAVRLFRPKLQNEDLPLLIYFHGGGWTFGSLNSCTRFCDALAANGNIAVLAIDYALAPEHPYPEGLKDCMSAIEYAFAHSRELGISSSAISLGGDSSGGNLALAAALFNNDNTLLPIKSIVLHYPVVKAEKDNTSSWSLYAEGYGLDEQLMTAFNKAYVSGCKTIDTPEYISPIYASDTQLMKLPEILMIGAERDILAGQGKEFADRCTSVGLNIQRVVLPGTVHLFITVSGQYTAFQKAVGMTAEFLNRK